MPYRKLGEEIQKIRKIRGISQEELAEQIQISRTHMGHIEQGRRHPSLPLMQKMATVLGVRVKDLIPF